MARQNKRIAVWLIRGPNDTLLMGRRKDNRRFTLPGGHCEDGESTAKGAKRELWEEAGLIPDSMRHIKTKKVNGNIISVFEAKIGKQKPTTENDPDDEFFSLDYLDPFDFLDNLHVPLKNNVALQEWMKTL